MRAEHARQLLLYGLVIIYYFTYSLNSHCGCDSFDDIIEFMSLWAYLRQESLILEVPRDVTTDDLGVLFELKPKEPKKETPFIIHRNENPGSSIKPIERIILDLSEFYPHPPIFLLSSYMDESWEINNERLKNCEEYIGKKILPTGRLRVFAKQFYTTAGEWQYRIPLLVSLVALLVSVIPIVQSLLPSKEPNYLEEINQQIATIESQLDVRLSDQDILDELSEIKDILIEVSSNLDGMEANKQSEILSNLAAQIEELNRLLSEQTSPSPTE